jgi:hypothetical protein
MADLERVVAIITKLKTNEERLEAKKEANQERLEAKKAANQERKGSKMGTFINTSQERAEAAITPMWSECEETMKSRVDGAQGHADQQNVAIAWSVCDT